MILTKEQQAILDGAQGETLAKVMKTLIKYGEVFGAEKMVPVTGKHNHLVTSFGLKALGPVYDLMEQLIVHTVFPPLVRQHQIGNAFCSRAKITISIILSYFALSVKRKRNFYFFVGKTCFFLSRVLQ